MTPTFVNLVIVVVLLALAGSVWLMRRVNATDDQRNAAFVASDEQPSGGGNSEQPVDVWGHSGANLDEEVAVDA